VFSKIEMNLERRTRFKLFPKLTKLQEKIQNSTIENLLEI